jgi:fermentation-respiration switch protein FrsA (DUF1100 family)
MKNIHVFVLIVNDARDQVIPTSEGKQLYDLANKPRQFYLISGRGHNDCFDDFAMIGLDWVKGILTTN